MLVMDLLAAVFFVALIWLLVDGPSHTSRLTIGGPRVTERGPTIFRWHRDFQRSWRPGYLPLMAMRFTLCLAVADFGSDTFKTPFLNEADTLSSSIPSTAIWRSKRP